MFPLFLICPCCLPCTISHRIHTRHTHEPCPQLQKYQVVALNWTHIHTYTYANTYTYTHTQAHIYTHHRNLAGVSTACWPFEIHHPGLGGPADTHLNRNLCLIGHIYMAHLFLWSSPIRRQGAVLPHHIRTCVFIKEENQDFPGGPVDRGPPANAGDTCSISGPGRFPMLGCK